MYIDYDGKRERYIEAMVKRVTTNIRSYRTDRGLTQAALAELAGFSTKHMGNIEKGNVNFSLETLFGCAFAFEIPVEEMFSERAKHEAAPVEKTAGTGLGALVYEVVEDYSVTEDGERIITFGIEGYRGEDGARVLEKVVHDISTDRRRVELLACVANEAGLAPAHLFDVIDDFLL